MMNLTVIRRALYVAGVLLLLLSALLILTHSTGLVTLSSLLPGESAIHSVARIAVVGCLLAAVGSLD